VSVCEAGMTIIYTNTAVLSFKRKPAGFMWVGENRCKFA
jgi:hypothetical protein